MNQVLYTANSLVRVDSLIIRIGLAVGLLSAILLAVYGFTIGFSVLAAIIAMAIAHRAYLLKRSERRLMVPGLNDTTANVSIAIAVFMWLAIAFLILGLNGFALERIAFSLLLIAFATWFGWGERLVFAILFTLVVILLLMGFCLEFMPASQAMVFEFLRMAVTEDLQYARNFFSIPLATASFWALYRYRMLAVADCATGSEKRLDYLIEQKMSNYLGLGTTGNIATSETKETPARVIPRTRAKRLVSLLYCRTSDRRFEFICWNVSRYCPQLTSC